MASLQLFPIHSHIFMFAILFFLLPALISIAILLIMPFSSFFYYCPVQKIIFLFRKIQTGTTWSLKKMILLVNLCQEKATCFLHSRITPWQYQRVASLATAVRVERTVALSLNEQRQYSWRPRMITSPWGHTAEMRLWKRAWRDPQMGALHQAGSSSALLHPQYYGHYTGKCAFQHCSGDSIPNPTDELCKGFVFNCLPNPISNSNSLCQCTWLQLR